MPIQEHFGTVTQKGQVTIPQTVRKLLGVKPYDRVTFRITGRRVELLPANMTLEATFGAVEPRSRPENWKALRRHVREERALRAVSKMRARRRTR